MNTDKKQLKVLYLFAGERKEMQKKYKAGQLPDTLFIGLNYMKNYGIEADYIESPLINKLRKINFNLANLFLVFKIKKYDVVFSGGSLLIIFLSKVLLGFKKPKFVIYNTFLTNMFSRNKGLKKWAIKKVLKKVEAIVCPSQAQKDFLVSHGVSSKKLHLILNGVDVDFIQDKLAKANRVKSDYILAVGKDMGRDYKTLVEATKDLNVKVRVVAYPRNFKDVKIASNLVVSKVPFMDLIELYKNAKLVVLPTKREGHPDASDCSGQLSLLDAMACGQAIIASRRDTIDDYAQEGETVILVEPENPKQLKQAIIDLLGNQNQRQELGDNALKLVKEKFTTKILAKNLANLFKNL